MSYITDKDINSKLIQPIRFFRNTYGDMIDKRNYNYFQSSKKNVTHQLIHVPTLKLIKFQLQFPAYYYSLTECKIYCPDRTTSKFDIKADAYAQGSLTLTPYVDSENNLFTQLIYSPPASGFSGTCPAGLGVIRVIATDGTTPITWESDVIKLFDNAEVFHGGAPYDGVSDIIDDELGI